MQVSIKLCNSVDIVSLAPKLAIAVCKLHVPPLLEYHQATLSFQIPHPISTPVEQINQT